MKTQLVALLLYLEFSYSINFKHNNTNWAFIARFARDLIFITYSSAVYMMYPALFNSKLPELLQITTHI